ncbi:MAG TPA: glycoside hydrolase family 3 N-terminal domain-containing protein [Solirubrobacteraceae bacterium]|nr:glycoside hydrolase family 3 N-terminal domain-containing protein [Solirubrobacteraceae bacterium]
MRCASRRAAILPPAGRIRRRRAGRAHRARAGRALAAALGAVGLAAAGVPAAAGAPAQTGHLPPGERSLAETGSAEARWRVDLRLSGQRVIFSYRGLVPPPALVSAIRAGEAAGVILFADNIASRAQIARVIAGLQRDALSSPVAQPLVVMTDQEGGQVRRLPGPPDLSESEIGSSRDPLKEAASAGRAAGRNLRGVGIDVNLAPVLDVARSADGFIARYGRSYGPVAAADAALGAAFIAAQQRTGVAATAKHFPGLGAAAGGQDTDLGPVTLRVPLRTLRSVDELPYRAAIAAGVKLVMVSWAIYPALDPRMPAGLSPAIVSGELRGRLGFAGVTVSDALGAGALRAFGSTAERAVDAARAGIDLLLCADQSVGEGIDAVGALAGALRDGRLPAGAFRAALARIARLRTDA